MLQTYYPGGEVGRFEYGNPGGDNYLLSWYRVPQALLEILYATTATYTTAGNTQIKRVEPGFGTTGAPPELTYPASATWTGGIAAPAFARYRFKLAAPGEGRLAIDGVEIVTKGAGAPPAEGEVILARGLHEVGLSGTLAGPGERIELAWAAGNGPYAQVPRKYIWAGPGRGLLGSVYPLAEGQDGDLAAAAPGGVPLAQARVDGAVGFGNAPGELSRDVPLLASWVGSLKTEQAGTYAFEIVSGGQAVLLVDGQQVLANRPPSGERGTAQGTIPLAAGAHEVEVRYRWSSEPRELELFWTPPGGQRALLGPDALSATGGAWLPGGIAEPPAYEFPPDVPFSPAWPSPRWVTDAGR
jgi:hypothetical protein